jgi:hypothetical protein
LNQADAALELFERVVAGGHFCYPAISDDPWLDGIRERPAFASLLAQVEQRHCDAAAEFARLEGDRILGIGARAQTA